MTGEDVKLWRRKLGMTQAALAAALRVSFRTVSAWENSRQVPPAYLELAFGELLRRKTPNEASKKAKRSHR